MKTKYVECHCTFPEHLCRFSFDDEHFIYLDVNLSTYLPWWRRIWEAIKYIFGSQRCGWAEILLDEEKISQIIDIFDEYRKQNEIHTR